MLSQFHRTLLTRFVRPEWPRAALLGALLCGGIALQLANPQIASIFIDRAQSGDALDELVWIALLFLVVALLTHAVTVAETYVAEDLGWRTTNALRAELMRHVLGLDATFFVQHTPGELIERIDGDVSAIADFFARFIVNLLGSSIFLVGVLLLLFLQDWRIGVVLSFCTAMAFLCMTRTGGFVARRAGAARQTAADSSSFLEEALTGLADIKSSGADAYAMRRLHQYLAALFHAACRATLATALFNAGLDLLFILATAAALALSAWLYFGGALTLGGVFVVFRYTAMVRQPLEQLARQMNGFHSATGGLVRVRDLLSARTSVVDGPIAALPARALSLELDDVWFSYADQPVLRGISLRVDSGEVLGVVGRTGAGKTTISRLIFRSCDPDRGAVRLNGIDVRDLRLDVLRERIGWVTQEVQLFQATLRENVTLFDETVHDTRLRHAFGELGLADWLDALPDGLDTLIGLAGRGLSAGEAQLVALARVFLKDPGLIVLDEASARLDPATARLLEGAITRLLRARTGLVIAHRLATLERVDQVVVLEDGHVVELGRRGELARDPDSRFARLLRSADAEVLV